MRKQPKRKRIFTRFKIALVIIFILILIIHTIFESYIEPSIIDITRVKAEELCNDAVNIAVLEVLEENNFDYTDFANITLKEQAVTSISSNSINANKFKSLVAIKAQDEIDNMSGTEINYKLGDFSSFSLLAGRGPDLTIKLFLTSSITTDIISEFESCAVNQTKHTISIKVTSKVFISSLDEEETYTIVETTVPVAENVIVGNTPSFYVG